MTQRHGMRQISNIIQVNFQSYIQHLFLSVAITQIFTPLHSAILTTNNNNNALPNRTDNAPLQTGNIDIAVNNSLYIQNYSLSNVQMRYSTGITNVGLFRDFLDPSLPNDNHTGEDLPLFWFAEHLFQPGEFTVKVCLKNG